MQYRLQRASDFDHVEVLIQGGQADPVEEAKKVFDVPNPDFIQVRTVRGAVAERELEDHGGRQPQVPRRVPCSTAIGRPASRTRRRD